jgi:hypothetical protein
MTMMMMMMWQARVDGREEQLSDVTTLSIISTDFTNTEFTEVIESFNFSTFDIARIMRLNLEECRIIANSQSTAVSAAKLLSLTRTKKFGS